MKLINHNLIIIIFINVSLNYFLHVLVLSDSISGGSSQLIPIPILVDNYKNEDGDLVNTGTFSCGCGLILDSTHY